MTTWIEEELDHKPEELEVNYDEYIQRKNIKEVTKKDKEGRTYKAWTCQMRFLKISEYEMLKAMQNIMAGGTEV